MLKKLRKKFHKHKWNTSTSNRQRCLSKGCECERILTIRKYPRLFETQAYWKIIDWDELP